MDWEKFQIVGLVLVVIGLLMMLFGFWKATKYDAFLLMFIICLVLVAFFIYRGVEAVKTEKNETNDESRI